MENTIVVVGSINVDVFNIEPTQKYQGTICKNGVLKDTYILPGGKGANQAAVASWLGAKVYMLGIVGDDEMGAWVLNIMKSQGVDVSRVNLDQKAPTSVVTINAQNKSYFVSPGANINLNKAYINANLDIIKKANLVLTQLEAPLETINYLASICNQENIPIILNPDPKITFNPKFFAKFSYVTPNRHELKNQEIAYLTNKTNTIVIQTFGKDGAIHYQKNNKQKHYKSPKQKVVCSIGAGDTFSGTLAYYLVNNYSLDIAIKKAIQNSSWSVRQLGAQKLPIKK